MNKYTIYCTEEQTRKSLELGAPVKEHGRYHADLEPHIVFTRDKTWLELPTAEQMIGWLEEQDIIKEIEIGIYEDDKWTYMVHMKSSPAIVNHTLYNSRKETTIAAIDAALDYLLTKKQ